MEFPPLHLYSNTRNWKEKEWEKKKKKQTHAVILLLLTCYVDKSHTREPWDLKWEKNQDPPNAFQECSAY